jgi:CheY-like chemotaxis protein
VLTDDTREHLRLLRGRVSRLEQLVEGILQYSRSARLFSKPEAVSLGALAQEVWELIAAPASARLHLAPDLPTLVTEKVPLQQVLMNLISNAIKYNPSPSPNVWIGARELGGRWEISVRDDGPGIAPRFHDRIWVIFQTLQPRDEIESIGIGLAVVRKIIEAKGGPRMGRLRRGTRRDVLLHVATRGRQEVVMDERALNIMLVDDDEVDIMNVKRAFARANIANPMFVAHNGIEALEALRSGKVPPARRLVLLDINMPRMNGIEFLREVRKDPDLQALCVVVLTTSNEDRDRIEAYQLNVAGYLVKPVTFVNFVDVMATLNKYWTVMEMP